MGGATSALGGAGGPLGGATSALGGAGGPLGGATSALGGAGGLTSALGEGGPTGLLTSLLDLNLNNPQVSLLRVFRSHAY